ncbi:MAG: OB-fold putative lipoprotein, partial [Planctomycetaceae bacterium]|nr:OB-fold putative lipoprotein [Planctomycetaceae bacterium]
YGNDPPIEKITKLKNAPKIRCYFSDSAASLLTKITKGDRVQIIGTCIGKKSGQVCLINCDEIKVVESFHDHLKKTLKDYKE